VIGIVAHAGHWLTSIGFALAPLSVIAAAVGITIADRRRARRD